MRTCINTSLLEVLFTSKIRDHEEGIVIYPFYTWFSFLTWVWATYFWKSCKPRLQQLTFFNQAWEIGPQAWAGMRWKFFNLQAWDSRLRHESCRYTNWPAVNIRLSHQFARLFLPSLLTFFHKKNKKYPAEKLHWTPAQKLNETPVQAPVNTTPKRKYQCVELIHLLTQIQKCGRAGEKSKKASQLAKHMAMPLQSSLDPHLILENWQQWFDFSFA